MTPQEMIEQAEQLLAGPEPLRAWLYALAQKNQDCGLPGKSSECPVHNFLADNGLDIAVGSVIIAIDSAGGDLLEWAITFVRGVDEGFDGPVPARSALAILDQIIGGY